MCSLKANGYKDVNIWMKKYSYTKTFTPLIEHRPETNFYLSPLNQEIGVRALANNLGFNCYEIEDYNEIASNGIYLICGAGILPREFVERNVIINTHPGFIPNVRGLDAFKWAIYEGLPVGVTSHLIGEEIDAGEIIERKVVPIYKNDTFYRVAQRVYETEIAMLVNAIELLANPRDYISAGDNIIRKRMPHAYEVELLYKFEQYKEKWGVE